jgi:L-methionine (R)-S-oxide reductase
MAETLLLPEDADKETIYREIIPQIKSIIESEDNLVANLANITAVLRQSFDHFWTGFYLRDGTSLVLGPFQGDLACTRIPLEPVARGVCGAAAAAQKTLIVPDVDAFPGHIACSSASKSEIVVPLVANGVTELVLDIDSAYLDTFDAIDQQYLEQVVEIIRKRHF